MSAIQTFDFHRANTFIVIDVCQPGQRIVWESMFRPCLVMSKQMLLCGNGPWIQHTPSFQTAHFIYISDAFKNQHAHLSEIVEKCLREGDASSCRWKLVDLKSWKEKLESRTAARFKMHCLALLTEEEKRVAPWRDLPGAMTTRTFVKWRALKTMASSYLGQAQL